MVYKLNISCTKNHLKEIRVFVADVLRSHSYPEAESNKIILAVDEICANLIIHSNHCNPIETLELLINYKEEEKIVFEIKDRGEGFDLSGYQEPSIQDLIKARRKGGIGLLLVKRIMDKIEFVKRNGQNICRLEKNLT